MKQIKKIPSINVPIQKADGSLEWVWYMFLQWLSEHLGDTDLSDYFTKEETEALLNTKANVDDLSNVAFSGDYDDLSNKPTIPTVGDGTITLTQGGVTKGTFTTNQPGDATIDFDAVSSDGYHPDLFDFKWADHVINDVRWVRADTFSWQNGEVYQAAYNHLVDDLRYSDQNDFALEVQNTDLGNNTWESIVWDGTKFVAVSFTGYISTSTDGTTWTPAVWKTDLGNNGWYSVAWNGTKFVALGSAGYISTSTDGTTWTTATQNANLGSHNWYSIVWDGTKFVVLGRTGYISTSTDGATWATAVQNIGLGSHGWWRIAWNGTKFVALGSVGYISTSTDGTTWTTATQNANLGSDSWHIIVWDGTKFVVLGRSGYTSYSCSGTETISGTTISYFTAQDGHKIVLPDQESNVVSVFTATSVAWYYILDTANQRFKLPRTTHNIVGVRDTVGKYVAPGLPNITGDTKLAKSYETPTGAFVAAGTSSASAYGAAGSFETVRIDASQSNSIYGNSTTVQPPATQMYLYFYVGEFTQTAIENTAGLNAELFNNKADIDLGNLSTTGKEVCANMAMPSNRYTDLTVGAVGSTYTAPADGYFVLRATATAVGEYLETINMTNGLDSLIQSGGVGLDVAVFMPVSKGQIIIIYYSTNTPNTFRFIYANGAQ